MTSWYYVKGKDRVGPVSEDELANLAKEGVLAGESYVWRKGFDNWTKLSETDELSHILGSGSDSGASPLPIDPPKGFDWNSFSHSERIFSIKIGVDRGCAEAEYGPFSMEELKRAFDEKRINQKTYIFTVGMDNWVFLADSPIFDQFNGSAGEIEDDDRRSHIRKPFLARMLFHDQETVYEGVCRDISVGGLQVLVSDFPGKVGENVTMNVHPDNGDYCFVASGKIVRLLDGNQGFSLVFSGLEGEAKEAIESYISG